MEELQAESVSEQGRNLAVVSLRPPVVLFLICLAYAVSGYVLRGMGTRVRRTPELP